MHIHPETEQLHAGHTNIYSMRGSKPQHIEQNTNRLETNQVVKLLCYFLVILF